ncbi:hypothetical protein JKG47_05995 [Acidithiobacillus sp. MC6.1]|nr:hypothetical protein [Acidithiobacillus sp. MC6.1]
MTPAFRKRLSQERRREAIIRAREHPEQAPDAILAEAMLQAIRHPHIDHETQKRLMGRFISEFCERYNIMTSDKQTTT